MTTELGGCYLAPIFSTDAQQWSRLPAEALESCQEWSLLAQPVNGKFEDVMTWAGYAKFFAAGNSDGIGLRPRNDDERRAVNGKGITTLPSLPPFPIVGTRYEEYLSGRDSAIPGILGGRH